MDRYWLPHPEKGFTPCWIQSQTDKEITFKDDENQILKHPKSKQGELGKVSDTHLLGVDNICQLETVSKAALLYTVRVRFLRKEVYTRVARILIAVNPFEALPIYGSTYMEKYLKLEDSMDEPPHVFGTGQDAVSGLQRGDNKNQAVLISGESGAGKTESTKLVLSYIAEAIGSKGGGLQDRILQVNPILEAFGNAMTVRNNNSSRFGKWLQIAVNGKMEIQGCSVTDYLLELSRVTRQGEKERNYHIFFMLAQAASGQLKDLNLQPPEQYDYLKHAQMQAPGINDASFFEELVGAFETLQFSQTVQMEIFKVVMGVLTLGNAAFKEVDNAGQAAAVITNEEQVQQAASLLGIEAGVLSTTLQIRKLKIGADVTEKPRTPDEAVQVRDALARLIYGKIFKWLVEKINVALGSSVSGGQFFGVLDIAGFECFEVNSLEQLNINLGNEHLQQHFNRHIFEMELADYKSEGVVAESLSYNDNSDIVELIDSKTGILAMLDEEINIPKANDKTFMSKVIKAHEKHKRMIAPKFAGANHFGIRHFAGDVQYTVDGFLEKNMDKPPEDAPDLLKGSSLSVLKEIADKVAVEMADPAGGKKKAKTVCSGFRASLKDLVEKLNSAEPHFIRCIKPNKEKVKESFVGNLVLDQLNCSGVFEAVRIRQAGYSGRVPYREFNNRYFVVVPKAVQKSIFVDSKGDEKANCQKLVEHFPSALSVLDRPLGKEDILFGKTKLFVKTDVMNALNHSRDMVIAGFAVEIQRFWRAYLVRRLMRIITKTFKSISTWFSENNFYTKPGSAYTASAKLGSADAIEASWKQISELLVQADKTTFTVPHRKEIDKVKHRMEKEAKEMRHIQSVETSVDPMDIEKALLRAKDLDLQNSKQTEALELRLQRLKIQLPLVELMKNALESGNKEHLAEAVARMKKEKLDVDPKQWIPELKGAELAAQVNGGAPVAAVAEKPKAVEQANGVAKAEAAPQKTALVQRKSISAVAEVTQDKVMAKLAQACQEYDVPALEENLRQATTHGYEQTPQLKEAQELFDNMEREAFIEQKLKDLRAELVSGEKSTQKLKIAQNLVNQASKLEACEEVAGEVRKRIQELVKLRARTTITGHAFKGLDLASMNLLEGAFHDLSTFSKLKPLEAWLGHKDSGFSGLTDIFWSSAGFKDISDMLKHSSKELRSALTKVLSCHETAACQMFRNMQNWMHDRPVPELQRVGIADDIVHAMQENASALADEGYVQIMKQLTENPSLRSKRSGWQLMLRICQHITPSEDLSEYVHAFLLKSAHNTEDPEEIHKIAQQALADLNIVKLPHKINNERDIPVQVLLIDQHTRKLHAPESITLRELAEMLCKQLLISQVSDFGFFQVTDGLDAHRMMPDDRVTLGVLCEKFTRLKKATGRTSRLMFKRRFLTASEALHPGDLGHAALTFSQAMWDYLHYPVSEELDILSKIAASILYLEYDHYAKQIAAGRLHDPGVLEHLLPQQSINDQKRYRWAQDILAAYRALEQDLMKGVSPGSAKLDVHAESRMTKMSRTFTQLKRLKLFGTFYWLGKQIPDIGKLSKDQLPPDLKDVPQVCCKVNPKEPDAQYWVTVDDRGMRFVAVDSKPGQSYVRGFLFSHEAVDCILAWAAKANILQLIVSTVNPLNPTAGRVPMTIIIQSPSAVDIAFTIYALQHMSEKGAKAGKKAPTRR